MSEPGQNAQAANEPQQQTEGSSNTGDGVPPTAIVIPIDPQGPPPPPTENEARARRTERRDRSRLWVEVGALIVGLFGVAGLLLTLCETIKATKAATEAATAAKNQVGLMQKQLEMSERPWVTIQFKINGPFIFDDKGEAHIELQYTIKNIGHSVAKNINIESQAYLQPFIKQGKFHEALDQQKVTCDRALVRTDNERKHGFTLFPNDKITGGLSVTISKKEIDAITIPFPDTFDKYIAPGFVGCVTYEFPFPSDLKLHQTQFAYTVSRADTTRPSGGLAIQVDKTLPAEQLRLEKYFFGGNDAN